MLERKITAYTQSQSLPLLITKLSLIRDNYNTSIEKRKRQVQARERKIKLHEQQRVTMCSNLNKTYSHRHKGMFRSLSPTCISNEHNTSNNHPMNKLPLKHDSASYSVKHCKDLLLGKPISKQESYMNKTHYKINFRKSQSDFGLSDKSNILSSPSNSNIKRQSSFKAQQASKTPKHASHNKPASLFDITLNNVKKHEIIIPQSKRYINKNVYGISNELLDKLKKIQSNKKELNLKDYHQSLIALGKDMLTKDNVKRLGNTFNKMRRDTNVKVLNTKRFLRWIEYKEEKIIDNINRSGLRAMFLFKTFHIKANSKELRHIRFEPVVN